MDEKEIDNEYGFEEETSERNDGEVEVDSGATETEEANTSVEDSAVETQEVESNDIDFENNYTTPQDYSWLVNVSDEDISKALEDKASDLSTAEAKTISTDPFHEETKAEMTENEAIPFATAKELETGWRDTSKPGNSKEELEEAQKKLDEDKDLQTSSPERKVTLERDATMLPLVDSAKKSDVLMRVEGMDKPQTQKQIEEAKTKLANEVDKLKSVYEKTPVGTLTMLFKQSELAKELDFPGLSYYDKNNTITSANGKVYPTGNITTNEGHGVDIKFAPKSDFSKDNLKSMFGVGPGREIGTATIHFEDGSTSTFTLHQDAKVDDYITVVDVKTGKEMGGINPNTPMSFMNDVSTIFDNIPGQALNESSPTVQEARKIYNEQIADAEKKITNLENAKPDEAQLASEWNKAVVNSNPTTIVSDSVYTEPLVAKREAERPGVTEFQSLNLIKDKVNNINVDEVKDEAQAITIQNDLAETQAQLIEQSHTVFVDIVKELVSQGKELKEIRESEQIKGFSQEVFEIAQSIYDKASVLEEKAKALGLDEYANVSIEKKVKTTANAAWDAVIHGKSMNSNEAYAVMNTMQSIEGVKSASLALMKSAAFNGATDVKGGKAAEAMKAEVVSKLSWKDFASTSLWGGLGILATGIGIVTGNPLLVAAGIYVNLKKGGEFAGKVTMSNVTKGEQMFGMKDSKIMNPAIQVYNQSQEAANIGDPKSASTYVTATQGALEIISGLMLMIGTAGVGTGVGISNIKDGIVSLYKLNKGGLDGNTRTLISNIYVLGERVAAWSGMDIPELENLIQTLAETGADEADSRVTAEYGTSSTDAIGADSKYSGYREQAKDSNLATDYNEGMEQEVNEAVSDMKVKIFSVYNNEPDYIRNAIRKILKSFKENY